MQDGFGNFVQDVCWKCRAFPGGEPGRGEVGLQCSYDEALIPGGSLGLASPCSCQEGPRSLYPWTDR